MMADIPYEFAAGDGPLLVSMPHVGEAIPHRIRQGLISSERALYDTDWHVDRLYDFLGDRAIPRIKARLSRTVVDLNRPADDQDLYPGQNTTGLCPLTTFDGDPLYHEGQEPDRADVADRVSRYWQPYHQKLQEELHHIRDRHGFAILWDAHSIRASVPRLFEGRLPDLNFGTDGGRTFPDDLVGELADMGRKAGFAIACNGRFKGGHITRHYAQPERRIFTLQLELSQATYLNNDGPPSIDDRKAAPLRAFLRDALDRVRQFTSF